MAQPNPHTEALTFAASATAALSAGTTHEHHLVGVTFNANAQWAALCTTSGAGVVRELERYTYTAGTNAITHVFAATGPFPYGLSLVVSAAGVGIVGEHDWAESWLKGRC